MTVSLGRDLATDTANYIKVERYMAVSFLNTVCFARLRLKLYSIQYSMFDLCLIDFPRERVPVVLSPLIYREQEDITEDRSVCTAVRVFVKLVDSIAFNSNSVYICNLLSLHGHHPLPCLHTVPVFALSSLHPTF